MAAEREEGDIINAMFDQNEDYNDTAKISFTIKEEYDLKSNDNNKTDSKNIVIKRKQQFVGLLNQGATCYLNSLLQALYFTFEFRYGLYEMTEEELGSNDMTEYERLDNLASKTKFNDDDLVELESLGHSSSKAKRALVKAGNDKVKARELLEKNQVPSVKKVIIYLRRFFAQLQEGLQDSISTKELTDSFGWESREVFQQHDAHELNRILLDAIERSLKNTRKEAVINEIFQLHLVRRTLCLKCENCSERKENDLDCIVDIANMKTIYESLQNMINAEFLVGDNQYFCEKCQKKTDAKRSMAYIDAPLILNVAIKRFTLDYVTLQRNKINSRFSFPLIFDFEPYMLQSLTNQTRRTEEDEILIKNANEQAEKEKLEREKKKKKT